MNRQERIIQCKNDIARLQDELKKLESVAGGIVTSFEVRKIFFKVTDEIIKFAEKFKGRYIFIDGNGHPTYSSSSPTDKYPYSNLEIL